MTLASGMAAEADPFAPHQATLSITPVPRRPRRRQADLITASLAGGSPAHPRVRRGARARPGEGCAQGHRRLHDRGRAGRSHAARGPCRPALGTGPVPWSGKPPGSPRPPPRSSTAPPRTRSTTTTTSTRWRDTPPRCSRPRFSRSPRRAALPARAVLDAYIVGLEVAVAQSAKASTSSTTSAAGIRPPPSAPSARPPPARACCGSTREGVTAALSLAFSMAGGSKLQFGTMAKPLHAGLAAQHGVMAADARRGRRAAASPSRWKARGAFRDLFAGPGRRRATGRGPSARRSPSSATG